MKDPVDPRSSFLTYALPVRYFLLVALLALTAFLCAKWLGANAAEEQERYQEYTSRIVRDVTLRLHNFSMILQGSAGVFAHSESLSRSEWKAFCDYLQAPVRFPGIQGLGYAKLVGPDELERHQEEVRAEGFPDYRVWPVGPREVYSSIVYLEPFDERNQRAFGYDMFSEPVRRAAMERARDTGEVSLSRAVTLVQESGQEPQHGFLLYLPIYSHGIRLDELEKRRAALTGYVYSPFRVGDFMKGIFPEPHAKIGFSIYDGPLVSPSTLLYQSQESSGGAAGGRLLPGGGSVNGRPAGSLSRIPSLSSQETVELYGHQWTMVFEALPGFRSSFDRYTPFAFLAAGVLISLLVFLFLRGLEQTNARAFTLAQEMTSALRESEERYRALNDSLTIGVSIIGPNMEVLAVNATQRNWFPRSDYDSHPPCYIAFYHPPRLDACKGCPVVQSFRDGRVHTGEREAYSLLGKRTLFITAVPLLDADGKVRSVHETLEDITERRQAEEDLGRYRGHLEELVQERTAALGKLSQAVEQSPVSVIITDRTGAIEYVNPKFTRISGYSSEEVLGRNPRILQSGEQSKAFYEAMWKTLTEGNVWRGEFHNRRKDGHLYWESASISPLRDEQGAIVNYVGVKEDITERKRTEEALREAMSAADAANRAKSVFLANMSHEIRTPMNAILGFAQVLERDPSLGSQQIEHLRIIIRSGNHLLALINDILDISKIEAGRMTLNPSVFSLAALLNDLELLFRSRAASKDLRFIVERDPTVPGQVITDESKFRQILVNLLGNALKFTTTGGITVRMRAEPAPGKPVQGQEVLRLVGEVEDTGPGIPEKDLPELFSTFFQAEAGLKVGGTGLGLAISRGFARMMGGDISVSSQVGKGSLFRFQVLVESARPATEPEKPRPRRVVGLQTGSGPLPSGSPGGPFRVLVADDVQENRALLIALLVPAGFEVREAVNGAEALSVCEGWSPHAVLMDMRMPVLDGYEAIRRLKATETGRTIQVIAVTASAFEENEKQVLAAGADAYLRKPITPEALFSKLGKCLGLQYQYAEEEPEQRNPPRPSLQDPSTGGLRAGTTGRVLPAALRKAMRQSVADGDMIGLAKQIIQAGEIDPAVARDLQGLADRYDYESLAKWLGKGEDADE